MSILPKAIYIFNAIPIKIPMAFFFGRNRKIHPKIHTKSQGNSYSQRNLEKEQIQGFPIPETKTYYKCIGISATWFWP